MHDVPIRPAAIKLTAVVAKYGISLSILAYLLCRAASDDSFLILRQQPMNWPLLLAALAVALLAVLLSFVRLHLLARALGLPFTLGEAVRFGFVGYLFNFLSLGVVGGDMVKAVFLARLGRGSKTDAVTSVFVDRFIALYTLSLLASAVILASDLDTLSVRNPQQLAAVQTLCRVTLGLTVAGTLGVAIVVLSTFFCDPLTKALCRIPQVGHVFGRVAVALQTYRNKPWHVFLAGLMSLAAHGGFAICVYLIACALPGKCPSLGTHFIVVPMATVAGTLPLPGGMGAFEYALDFLYRGLSSLAVAEGQGIVVALTFRIITILVALVGAVYYLAGRNELSRWAAQTSPQETADRRPADAVDQQQGTAALPASPPTVPILTSHGHVADASARPASRKAA